MSDLKISQLDIDSSPSVNDYIETLDVSDTTMGVSGSNKRISLSSLLPSTYIYDQTTPSSTWTIVHNLNRYPSVMVIDSAGSDVVGEIQYNSANQITITFSGGFAGKAYLN